MNSLRINTITWLLLVLLTIAGYFVSKVFSFDTRASAVALILLATIIKFLSVGFQFLDLKEANMAWRVIFVVFILMFSMVIFLFARQV